jgi:hypothetical protein
MPAWLHLAAIVAASSSTNTPIGCAPCSRAAAAILAAVSVLMLRLALGHMIMPAAGGGRKGNGVCAGTGRGSRPGSQAGSGGPPHTDEVGAVLGRELGVLHACHAADLRGQPGSWAGGAMGGLLLAGAEGAGGA